MIRLSRFFYGTCCILIGVLLVACKDEIVPEPFRPRNAYDAYSHALKQTGLHETALGKEWFKASENALLQPIQVVSPYKESLYLNPSKAEAVGYRLSVKRGQKIEIAVSLPPDSLKIFIDLFRVNNDSLKDWRHVASADTVHALLGFEPRRDADYILRLQPELLRGGRFEISIRQVPSLDFPVLGKNSHAIGSFFGDSRDGGKREHHGVDIFASRNTPILVPSKAYVRNVSVRGLGGKVVWLYDAKRRMSMYFAHLDSQIVKSGTYVEPGDTIGMVGNTGNARYTPPHLHFGIYSNGPIDPYYYLKETKTTFDPITVSLGKLGTWMRIQKPAYLMETPTGQIPMDTLKVSELVEVTGASAYRYRVRLPDGRQGFIPDGVLEPIETPIEEIHVATSLEILQAPGQLAIGEVHYGDSLEVLGAYNNFKMVRTATGQLGWISLD